MGQGGEKSENNLEMPKLKENLETMLCQNLNFEHRMRILPCSGVFYTNPA